MGFENITSTCVDCSSSFVFTTSEQEFYKRQGLPYPKRCKTCRERRKNLTLYDNLESFQKKMYDVICSECGCETQVPFQPLADKPAYCKECLYKIRGY
ncbi:MAG: zinc-ribbon domain containing protein [Candidatus Gastranaerophilales bacterium]|nr:zinc-ribbon domain containing protein [Candidatus Gastranaerophilales bacterium]